VGHNIAIEGRYAEDNVERLPALAAELVRLHVDVIVAYGTPATRAAKQATSTIPIIMTAVGVDPVEAGLVASMARPGGNVTGTAAFSTELWGKRLELLKEAVPRLSRLAVLWNPANPGNAFCVKEIQAVALAMGVPLQPLEVRDANAFEHAFAKIAMEPPDALLTCLDPLTLAHARPIADFAVRSRLPTLTAIREYVQAGVLMSYGRSLSGEVRRAAYYMDKILKGTKPADLPVEGPMQFELVINLKTAQALGLTLPPTLLFQAAEVIQ
jgi:putative ABC transport system substrate-binding protein